jgi:hypothetical protein
MKRRMMAAAALCALSGAAGAAQAQSGPAQTLEPRNADPLRVQQSFTVFAPVATPTSDTFESDDGLELRNFLDAGYLAGRTGTAASNINAITGQFTFRGLRFVGESGSFLGAPLPNQTAAAIRIYAPDLGGAPLPLLSNDPALGSRDRDTNTGCVSFIWDSVRVGTPAAPPPSFTALRAEVHGRYVDSLEGGPFGACISQLSARFSASDPLVGNPNSVQGQALRTTLSFDDAYDFGVEEEPEIIGLAVNGFSSNNVDGRRLDGRYRRTFRIFEGSRARLLVDAPVSVLSVERGDAVQANLSVGVDYPVNDRWTVVPRAAVGVVSSDDLGGDGELYTLAVSSRYRFPQVGRGDLVVGNTVAYTSTGSSLTGGLDPSVQNLILRNGVAYQFPLRGQFMGRQRSIRASYIHTYTGGDEIFLDSYHEVSVNYGVRAREGDPRNRFELFRIGLTGTFGDNYQALTLTTGFRY